MEQVKTGKYRHYKGNMYRVLGVCRHSETDERLVVYQCLYGDFSLWVRPPGMFAESVRVGGAEVPRFEWVQSLEEADWLAVSAAGSSPNDES